MVLSVSLHPALHLEMHMRGCHSLVLVWIVGTCSVACKGDKAGDTSTGNVDAYVDPCPEYVDARADCVSAFGGNPADYGLDDPAWCDPYDETADEALMCRRDAWLAGDCETVDGYNAAVTAAEACAPLQ